MIDPEKVGVWVPLYVIRLAPSGSSALMLAQLSWLLQEDRTKTRRVPVIEEHGVEWIARADTDWEEIGLDRGGAYRARVALTKADLIEVQPRRRPCWLRPNYTTLGAARSRAIGGGTPQHGSVLSTTRKRATDNTEARALSLIGKTTPNQGDPPAADASVALSPTEADPIKRHAHRLTVLAFEQPQKPVMRAEGNPFSAVMAIFERLLRAGKPVGEVERAVVAGIEVWTTAGVQTAIAQANPRKRASEAGVEAAVNRLKGNGR